MFEYCIFTNQRMRSRVQKEGGFQGRRKLMHLSSPLFDIVPRRPPPWPSWNSFVLARRSRCVLFTLFQEESIAPVLMRSFFFFPLQLFFYVMRVSLHSLVHSCRRCFGLLRVIPDPPPPPPLTSSRRHRSATRSLLEEMAHRGYSIAPHRARNSSSRRCRCPTRSRARPSTR